MKWLQSQPFDGMIVVVLSSSEQRDDAEKAMNLGAQHYHIKEASSEKRGELVKLLEQYLTKGST